MFRKFWKGKMNEPVRTEPKPHEPSTHLQVLLTNGMVLDVALFFPDSGNFIANQKIFAHDGFVAVTGNASIPWDKVVLMRRYNTVGGAPAAVEGSNIVPLKPIA